VNWIIERFREYVYGAPEEIEYYDPIWRIPKNCHTVFIALNNHQCMCNFPLSLFDRNGFGLITMDYRKIVCKKNCISTWAVVLKLMAQFIRYYYPDKKRIAFGHSRLGKAAIWAGAQYDVFDGVISNNSGLGGASLFSRKKGETIKTNSIVYPNWFCDKLKEYSGRDDWLPIDQDELLRLIPKLYVASGEKDRWCDPKGEFIATMRAGLKADKLPPVNTPIFGDISYHMRTGRHGVTLWDWEQYIKWALLYIVNKK
jgi:hypothetical protein